jgi:DNA-binding GntR family transcriptional regulator
MSIPHVGWPMASGDDESAEQATTSAAPATSAVPATGGARTSHSDRSQRGSRRLEAGATQVAGPAASVLADRLAAALVHHEPGWRLPRHSALARRYNVSTAEIDTAVAELASRHLVRRLPDGQVYRASPAEYIISLAGIPGLTSYVDAMGGELSCRSRQVSWRSPPEDIIWALRLSADQAARVQRYLWTAGGEPAAMCTTYMPADVSVRTEAGPESTSPKILNLVELSGLTDVTEGGPVPAGAEDLPGGEGQECAGSATALYIELQAPPASVARSLRLAAGQPATIVTVRFDDDSTGRPVALTIAVLRPDMFRVVVQTQRPPLPDGDAGTLSRWTHALEGW